MKSKVKSKKSKPYKKFNIAIIGSGHVGLITGVVFADMGHNVICVDNDEKKINNLKKLIMPIYEPGLEELVKKNVKEKRLIFTTSIKKAVEKSLVVFICVGTPPKEDGEANLYYVEKVSREIAQSMKDYKVIVEKSTVPVETGEWVEKTVKAYNRNLVDFDVVSNPEFLREGQALQDSKHPDRIVIGTSSSRARQIMAELYQPFSAPIIFCDVRTAELIKHASNAYLATKISFINAIANICERVGADVHKVAEGMGYDPRIGRAFLNAGIGYGGFCFPKDVSAFIRIAQKVGYNFELLKIVEKINQYQRVHFVEKIKQALWILEDKTIGILGLSFKPNTDDLRFAPSLEIISLLQKEKAKIKVYDPRAMEPAKKILKKVKFCANPYETAKESDALILVTEWDEFLRLDWKRIRGLMRNLVVIDGRNVYSPEILQDLGFTYIGMGRGQI